MRDLSSSLEVLESRIAPAGLIDVSVSSAGILMLKTVAGADGDESLTITQDPNGGFLLTPGAQVTLRMDGSDFTTAQTVLGVAGINANLGNGSDALLLDGIILTKGVTVNLGEGAANAFSMTNVSVAGAVTVTGGGGTDTVSMNGTGVSIGGAVKMKLGAGDDLVNAPAARVTLNKGLMVDGGAGIDTLAIGANNSVLNVTGNLLFLAGDGVDVLALGTTTSTIAVTGAVSLVDKSGDESITFNGTMFQAGSVLLNAAGGENTFINMAENFVLTKGFTWMSKEGKDIVRNVGTTAIIGGNVVYDVGKGEDSGLLQYDTQTMLGSLTMKGAGEAGKLTQFGVFGDTQVNGPVKITAGVGDANLALSGGAVVLGKGVTMSSAAGVGDSLMQLQGTQRLAVNGAVNISTTSSSGNATLFGAAVPDTAITGNVTIKGGDNINVTMAGSIGGSVTLATSKTPATNPFAVINANGARGIFIGGAVNMTLASGGGLNAVVGILAATVAGGVKITTGAGNDTVNVDQLVSEKAVTVALGAGNDQLKLEQQGIVPSSIFRGTVLFKGEAGNDTFLLGGNTAPQQIVFFQKAVTVDGGADTDTVTVGTQVTFAPGLPLVQVNVP